MEYEIQPADVKGPFNKTIPKSLEKKAELKSLSYTGPRELLSEKFHIDPGLLTRLNPKASFEAAGAKILVTNVMKKPSEAKVAKIVVNKSGRTLRALDADGKLISFYPASVGSQERPAPSGTLPIRSVLENPTYHYSPELKFKGVKTKSHSPSLRAPTIQWATRGSISVTPTASMAPRSHRMSARPNLTDASASPIGMQRLWAKWSGREPRWIS